MDGLVRDLRFAIRSLLRAPVLLVTAVLTLAVGTGLATGVFAVAYGALLRPLPFADPDRLVVVNVHGLDDRDVGVRLAEFEEWRTRLRTFERVAASATAQFTIRGAGEPRTALGAIVTDRFFDTLGPRAEEGSLSIVAREPTAAVLSARLAQQLGGRPAWQDRGVTIATSSFQVAAVVPAAFAYPSDDVEFWVRADAVPAVTFFSTQDQRRFSLIGRLRDGASLAQAQDDVRRVVQEIDAPVTRPGFRRREASVQPVRERMRAAAEPTVLAFAAGAVIVLLIASANVSGLLAGRAVARQREFAIRRALGSGAGGVLRTALAESVSIAFAGWALGLWLAHLFVRAFGSLAAGAVPNLQAVRLDAPVVAMSLALAGLVAALSGVGPALRAGRTDPAGVLKDTSEQSGGGGRRMRAVLVVGQVAAAVVLIVAAGLLLRTVREIVTSARGFVSDHVLTERLMLTETVQFAANGRAPFVNRLVEGVRALPGVTAAGIGSDLPPGGTQIGMTIRVVSGTRDEMFHLGYAAATPGFLEAIGAELVRGRLFDDRDRLGDTPSAVITESAARMMFQDRDPIGRDWPAPMPGADGRRVKPRVIGVVRDIRYGGLDRTPQPTLFAPWEKLAPGMAHLAVRTSGPPIELAPAIRQVIQAVDPSIPISTPRTLDEVVSLSIADRRLRVELSGAFALLALALASIALWGLVAQGVLDRRHELAVRLAMGSTERGAVRLIVRSGALLIGIGLTLGTACAMAAGRALRHLLHGVSPLDPLTFTSACLLVLAVALLACYIPARRAATLSPADLLRN